MPIPCNISHLPFDVIRKSCTQKKMLCNCNIWGNNMIQNSISNKKVPLEGKQIQNTKICQSFTGAQNCHSLLHKILLLNNHMCEYYIKYWFKKIIYVWMKKSTGPCKKVVVANKTWITLLCKDVNFIQYLFSAFYSI